MVYMYIEKGKQRILINYYFTYTLINVKTETRHNLRLYFNYFRQANEIYIHMKRVFCSSK